MRLVYWECVYQRNLLWRWQVALARILPNEVLRRKKAASTRQRQLWADMNNLGPLVLRANKGNTPTSSNNNNNNSPAAPTVPASPDNATNESMFQVAAASPKEIRAMLVPAALAQGRSLLMHSLMPLPRSPPTTAILTIDEPTNEINVYVGSSNSNSRDVAAINDVNGGEELDGMDVLPVLSANRGSSGDSGQFVYARRYRYVVYTSTLSNHPLKSL